MNPLYKKIQKTIQKYELPSYSLVDYTLNRNTAGIFSKDLYRGQNEKGIFFRVKDQGELDELAALGKKLFYDPILSGNDKRACASCHKTDQGLTDTAVSTAENFSRTGRLSRNTPSLLNVNFNHLLMWDGTYFTLLHQAQAVVENQNEMGGELKQIIKKIKQVPEYRKGLEKFMRYTPFEKDLNMNHVLSAVIIYYSKFNKGISEFDLAMSGSKQLQMEVQNGFNLFMGKAACGTCHFAPIFNGVKPPYVNSEFEVLGVLDQNSKNLDPDSGRYVLYKADEMLYAFRTPTLRNLGSTAPYMHNGGLKSLKEVIEFYDAGGGQGKGLKVETQTLSKDSLHLSATEKQQLILFLNTLNEDDVKESVPSELPKSKKKKYNARKPGGEY